MAASDVGAGVAGMKDQYECHAIGGDQIVEVVAHGLTPCVDTPGPTPTGSAACSGGGGAGTNRLLKSKMRFFFLFFFFYKQSTAGPYEDF